MIHFPRVPVTPHVFLYCFIVEKAEHAWSFPVSTGWLSYKAEWDNEKQESTQNMHNSTSIKCIWCKVKRMGNTPWMYQHQTAECRSTARRREGHLHSLKICEDKPIRLERETANPQPELSHRSWQSKWAEISEEIETWAQHQSMSPNRGWAHTPVSAWGHSLGCVIVQTIKQISVGLKHKSPHKSTFSGQKRTGNQQHEGAHGYA